MPKAQNDLVMMSANRNGTNVFQCATDSQLTSYSAVTTIADLPSSASANELSITSGGRNDSVLSERPARIRASADSPRKSLCAQNSDNNSMTTSTSMVAALIPARPRRLWAVTDTKVPMYPSFYPKPSKLTSCFILSQPDAPPSVIAIRISECLLARSILTEYDEEAATATCLTVDRCLFVIHLWRVSPRLAPIPEAANDFILVECVRTTGSSFSFHRSARAVLLAAQSMHSGKDCRKTYQSSPLEFTRFVTETLPSHGRPPSLDRNNRSTSGDSKDILNTSAISTTSTTSEVSVDWTTLRVSGLDLSATKTKVEGAMDHVLTLLRKDRIKPQLLGMEQLVALTDVHSVGADVVLQASPYVLGRPDISKDPSVGLLMPSFDCPSTVTNEASCGNDIHTQWILNLLIHRSLPSELLPTPKAELKEHASQRSEDSVRNEHSETQSASSSSMPIADDDQAGKMRSLVLRAVSNSMSFLARNYPDFFQTILSTQSPVWTSEGVISSLIGDVVKGTSRPVQAVHLSRLSSQHDAAIACRILGLLCCNSSSVKNYLLKQPNTLDIFELAKAVGKSSHLVLANEAHRTYQILTEEDRSC